MLTYIVSRSGWSGSINPDLALVNGCCWISFTSDFHRRFSHSERFFRPHFHPLYSLHPKILAEKVFTLVLPNIILMSCDDLNLEILLNYEMSFWSTIFKNKKCLRATIQLDAICQPLVRNKKKLKNAASWIVTVRKKGFKTGAGFHFRSFFSQTKFHLFFGVLSESDIFVTLSR